MKKGFTMIELIFVIVILGILASVAIPKLAATRDDAEVSKAATNLTTAISDIAAYYTAKGAFDSTGTDDAGKIGNMTNATDSTTKNVIKIKTATCATLATAGNTISVTFADDSLCNKVKGMPGIAKMFGLADSNVTTATGPLYLPVGGSNVTY